jgi:hypothetical protein
MLNCYYLYFLKVRRLGVNFVNILQAALTPADPKSSKKTDSLTVFFALLESEDVKASSKMLMKLILGFPRYMQEIRS